MQQPNLTMKYQGRISPIHLYKLPEVDGKGTGRMVVRDEIFECPADYAAELMSSFNEKDQQPKFVLASPSEKVGAPQGRGRPPKDKELLNVGMIK